MRPAYFDQAAKKRTVSLTINADLFHKAKQAGINVSKVAESALALALLDYIKAEIRQDIAALDAYIEKYGSPVEHLRQHYGDRDVG